MKKFNLSLSLSLFLVGKKYKRFRYLFLVSFICGLMAFTVIQAAPPSSQYSPGETLAPSCSPGDANCSVLTPSVGTSTSGYAVFWTGTSTVSGNSSFYWDNTNKRLGIGTTTPSYKLAILGDLFVNTSSTLGTVISGTWNGTAIADSYISSASTWNTKITTSSLSESITGVDYNSTTGVFSLTSGYGIPLSASTSNWQSFFDSPSSRITAGANLSWSGNTLTAANSGVSTSSPFTAGYLVFATSSSAVSNSNIFQSGTKIGIGTTTPSEALHVIGTSTISGNLSLGGTVTSGTWNGTAIDFSSYVNATASSGIVFSGDSIVNNGVVSLTGTSNQVTVSSATGTITLSLPQSIATSSSPTFASTTLSNFTAGSIPFFGTSGVLLQNNSNLYWDNTNARLGVGTTTPASLLDVTGTVQLRGFSTSTTGLYVNGSGNVGIGTTTPVTHLHVSGTGNDFIRIQTPAANTPGIQLLRTGTGEGVFQLYGTSAHDFRIGYSTNGFSTVSDRMTVDTNGNVGIGMTSPATGRLNVRSDTDTAGTLIAQFQDSGTTAMVQIFNSADGTAPNSANAVIKIMRMLTTNRSINAAGTINASGADYAEWINWPDEKPEPGTIIRYKESWMVVSSSQTAAFTGNDIYQPDEAILVTFSGQVPVKVKGAVYEGDYIVPNGDGTGRAVNPDQATFVESQQAVGIAWETNTSLDVKKVNVAVGNFGKGISGQGDVIINQGNVGIGDTTPDYKLDVWGTICQDTDSNDVCDGTIISDAALKTNVAAISGTDALAKLSQLRGVEFDWDAANSATEHLGRGIRQVGVIAQEVEAVFPSLVYQDMQGYKMVDYQKLAAPLISAVNELNNRTTGVYPGKGLEAGDLVKFSETGEIVKTAGSGGEPAAGVVISFDAASSSARIAFSGKAPVKVSNESGPIKTGDYLTSSSHPGVAMKAVQPGRVIGTALEDFDGLTGKILVLVNPHWSLGSLVDDGNGLMNQFAAAVKTGLKQLGLFLENGVARLTEVIADKITAKEFVTEKLCVGSVCVTESQFMAVFGGSGESQPADKAAPSSKEETAQQPQETTVSETSATSTPAENQPTESSQPESSVSESSSDSESAAETSSITEETLLSSTDETLVSESPASE